MKKTIEITHFKEGRRKLVSVPDGRLKSKFVLYESDFDDLMALGVSPLWHYYHDSVAIVRSGGKEVPVGRLIRDAKEGQIVIAQDGNPFNLRRENLILAPGMSKSRARGIIVKPYKQTHTVKNIYN
jgi:hypothetical protein